MYAQYCSTPDIAAYDNTAFTGISSSPAAGDNNAAGSPTSNGGSGQQQNSHEMQARRQREIQRCCVVREWFVELVVKSYGPGVQFNRHFGQP